MSDCVPDVACDAEPDGEGVGERLRDVDAVAVPVREAVRLGVALEEGVAADERVGVGDCVALDVPVEDADGVEDCVCDVL